MSLLHPIITSKSSLQSFLEQTIQSVLFSFQDWKISVRPFSEHNLQDVKGEFLSCYMLTIVLIVALIANLINSMR